MTKHTIISREIEIHVFGMQHLLVQLKKDVSFDCLELFENLIAAVHQSNIYCIRETSKLFKQ